MSVIDHKNEIQILITKSTNKNNEKIYKIFSIYLFLLSRRYLRHIKKFWLHVIFSPIIQIKTINKIDTNWIIDRQDANEKLVNSGCWKNCKILIEVVDGVVGARIIDISITVAEKINTINTAIFNCL